MANAWDKQPYETDLQFEYFKNYYLSQRNPRTVRQAYRLYLIHEGKLQPNDEFKGTMPGYWQNMSRGDGSRAEKIPGSMSWAVRATAFDNHETNKRNEVRRELAEATKQKQFDDYETILDTWQILAESLRDKLLKESKSEKFDPRIYIKDFKTLTETRLEIAKFVSATVGELDTQAEPVTIVFEEGEIDDSQ